MNGVFLDAPQGFVDRLQSTFDGRLRIRWSLRDREFHIEQRIARAVVPPLRIAEDRDDLIRARDGYHFVMAITPGDRKPCPSCNYKLTVPVMETVDMRCPYCQLRGRQTRVVAGFWPLNDLLIEHLRKLDPLRGASEELAAEADRRNKALMKSLEADVSNQGMAALDDNYNRLVGIQQVGYTGIDSRESSQAAA